MRWDRGHRSNQVEDRRAQGSVGGRGVPFGLLTFLFRRFGILGVIIGAGALYLFAGAGSHQSDGLTSGGASPQGEANEQVEFVSFVLDDAQEDWTRIFRERQAQYPLATLVLFRGSTRSGCGMGQAQMGPFYCPFDQKLYLDLGFFEELESRFKAPGDFAQAYVVAHEIGHHVQNVLGTSGRVHRAPESEQVSGTGLSVRLELQADCYAGVWAYSAAKRNILDPGDLEEALKAASVIGDDALQRESGRGVHPETFTHGTSEQRSSWFRRGFDRGDMSDCNTFSGSLSQL